MSTATQPMTEAELGGILVQAQAANQRRGITGALVYGDGQFMQIVEGERSVLEALYAHIGQDKRHTGVFKLADRAIPARRFSEWSMAFQVVSPTDFSQLAGYLDPAHLTEQMPDLGAADSLFLERMRALVTEPAA